MGDHEFLQLMPRFNKDVNEGYAWTAFQAFWKMQALSSIHPQSQSETDFSFQSVSSFVSLLAQPFDGILNKDDCSALCMVYQLLHHGYDIQFMPCAYRKIKWIMYAGNRIGS